MTLRPALALATLLTIGGCADALGPSYYLLEAPGAAAPAATAGPVLGLREIALPLYARRPQMAVREVTGEVQLSDNHRWAEEPPRAATRLLARLLSNRTGRAIAIEPWSIDIDPKTLVQVEADYLIGSLAGEIRFSGQVRIIDRSGQRVVRIEPFEITAPVGETHANLAAAHGVAVAALADHIAELLGL